MELGGNKKEKETHKKWIFEQISEIQFSLNVHAELQMCIEI